jgi:peptidoglycan/LPS O-acetylase OafA/YrhL
MQQSQNRWEHHVARIAIFFGIVLAVLGIGLYAMSHPDKKSLTAFIPSAFGAALIVIGQVAQSGSAKVRMHSMHAAAVVGLIGLVIPAYRVIDKLSHGAEMDLAIGGSIAMAALCGIFLALCVKSFIDIRRARKQAQTTGEPTK